MTSSDELLDALDRFRGDIYVYDDGAVQLIPYEPDYRNAHGPTWRAALERLAKDQQRVAQMPPNKRFCSPR